MSGRKITYDEIVCEIRALDGIDPQDRREILLWIRDFKREIAKTVTDAIPKHLQKKVEISIT